MPQPIDVVTAFTSMIKREIQRLVNLGVNFHPYGLDDAFQHAMLMLLEHQTHVEAAREPGALARIIVRRRLHTFAMGRHPVAHKHVSIDDVEIAAPPPRDPCPIFDLIAYRQLRAAYGADLMKMRPRERREYRVLTWCRRGHLLAGENLRVRIQIDPKNPNATPREKHECRECIRMRQRAGLKVAK